MDEKDIIDDILNLRTSDSLFISFHAENLPSHYSGVMGGALRCAKTVTLVKRTNYMMINEEGDCGWVTVRSWVAIPLQVLDSDGDKEGTASSNAPRRVEAPGPSRRSSG